MDPLQALAAKYKREPALMTQKIKSVETDPVMGVSDPDISAPSARLAPGEKLELVVSDGIHLPAEAAGYIQPLLSALTFTNPAHAQAVKYGRIPPDEKLYGYRRDESGGFILPSGDLRGVINFFNARRVPISLIDRTVHQDSPIDIDAIVALPMDLQAVFSAASSKRSGIIVGGDGERERKIVSHLVAFHRQKTLILCHRSWQLYVWRNILTSQTTLKDSDIGLLGDGRHQTDRPVTIAIPVSLKPKFFECLDVGFLAVDGCGYVGMRVLMDIAARIPARHRIGLTGYDIRRDGLEGLMRAIVGDPVATIPKVFMRSGDRGFCVRRTEFSSIETDHAAAIMALSANTERTHLVAQDALALSADKKAGVVVAAVQLEQLEKIKALLADQYRPAEILKGSMSVSGSTKIVEDFKARRLQVVLTTTRSLDMLPAGSASAVVVAAPFRSRDTAAGVARLLLTGGVVQEYKDDNPLFLASFKNRVRLYLRFGLKERINEWKKW